MAEQSNAEGANAEMAQAAPRVLIVDDRPENLLVLERVLADCGAELVRAESGEAALKATLHQAFALAILDVQMPGMDGYELAEYLRGAAATRTLPIIFLTAVYSDDYHVFRGYEAGAVDFLTKPYRPEVLQAKVRVFLELDQQRRALERAVETERARRWLEHILLRLSDPVVVLDRAARVETVNAALLALLGGTAEGRHRQALEEVLEGGEAGTLAAEIRAALEASSPRGLELCDRELMLASGREQRTLLVSASPLYGEGDRVQGAVLMLKDVTEARAREQERILTEKMSALGMMVGGVAHELNNPLMGIINYVEHCLAQAETDDECRQILTDARRETKRCIELVQNLLRVVRVGPGEGSEVPTETDVPELIERVLRLLDYRIAKLGVQVEREFPDSGLQLRTRAQALQQVLLNLIVNALDALESSRERVLRVECSARHGEPVRIAVADTGCGIPPEVRRRIFDPFFTTKEVGRGTGLGLSVSRSLVEGFGGRLACESTPGEGTRFVVELPSLAEGTPATEPG